MNTAADLLSQRMNLNITFADIAEYSGMNTALIRYYFGSKEGLLVALAEREASHALEGLERLVKMDFPAEQKLRMHISGTINSYFRAPYLYPLLHHLLKESKTAAPRITEIFVRPVINAQRAILGQGIAEGVFRECDPDLFHFSLSGACDHIFSASGVLRHIKGEAAVTDELRRKYIEHVSDMFLGGLRRPQP